MRTAAILTRWQTIVDGDTPVNIPALFRDIVPAVGDGLEDITEQPNLPPTPNLVVVKATVSPDTLAKIKLHPLYGVGAILWENNDDIEAPVPTERLSAIVRKLARDIGVDERAVKEEVLAGASSDRSRADIINAIIAYLRFHPSQAPLVPIPQ